MNIDIPPSLIGTCEVLVLHANGVEERLNILSVETVPRFTDQPLVRIRVAPPLSFAADGGSEHG